MTELQNKQRETVRCELERLALHCRDGQDENPCKVACWNCAILTNTVDRIDKIYHPAD